MARTALKPECVLFDYQKFEQTPDSAGYTLTDNTALLAFLLIRQYGLDRGKWFYDEDIAPEQWLLGLEDNEYSIVSDWVETALLELKTANRIVTATPILGTGNPTDLSINDFIDIGSVDDPDCTVSGHGARVALTDGLSNPKDTEMTISMTDWFRPRPSCGDYSAIAWDSVGQIVLQLDRETSPEGLIITAAEIVIYSQVANTTTFTRLS